MSNDSKLSELNKRLNFALKNLWGLKTEQDKQEFETGFGFVYDDLIRDEEILIATLKTEITLLTGGNVLSLDDYQTRAKATDTYPPATRLVALLMGIANEAGETLGKYKKYLRGDESMQDENALKTALIAEIGDTLWYLAMVSDALGVRLSDVAQGNLDKLASRYERGMIGGVGDDR